MVSAFTSTSGRPSRLASGWTEPTSRGSRAGTPDLCPAPVPSSLNPQYAARRAGKVLNMAPYKTRKPKFSDTTIDLVRSAAHRHVRAGGSIFPVQDDDEAEQHI